MTGELIVLLGGKEVGRIRRHKNGRLTFAYDQAWREAEGAYPLSLSMPLAAAEHGSGAVEAFLWGLLPDNEQVLERWARKFHVSARNVFALIAHVGEDCAGAVQFVPPERLDTVLSGDADSVEWLDKKSIAGRLRIATLQYWHDGEPHDEPSPRSRTASGSHCQVCAVRGTANMYGQGGLSCSGAGANQALPADRRGSGGDTHHRPPSGARAVPLEAA